jgi:mono/diheme cytochrome c family protein
MKDTRSPKKTAAGVATRKASSALPPKKSAPEPSPRQWAAPAVAFVIACAVGALVTTAASGRGRLEATLDPTPGITRAAPERALPPGAGKSLMERRCATCHALGLILQQHLSPEAWQSEVKKMRGWGAFLDDDEAATVTAYLASTFGRDAPPFEPSLLDPREAETPWRAESVPGAPGDPVKGADLYKSNCAACHGEAAEGGRGPALRDRPIATQPFRFAKSVRVGRGDMPGFPTFKGSEMADILAFVRGR